MYKYFSECPNFTVWGHTKHWDSRPRWLIFMEITSRNVFFFKLRVWSCVQTVSTLIKLKDNSSTHIQEYVFYLTTIPPLFHLVWVGYVNRISKLTGNGSWELSDKIITTYITESSGYLSQIMKNNNHCSITSFLRACLDWWLILARATRTHSGLSGITRCRTCLIARSMCSRKTNRRTHSTDVSDGASLRNCGDIQSRPQFVIMDIATTASKARCNRIITCTDPHGHSV